MTSLDDDEELLFCLFGEKCSFLTVLGGGTWKGGGDGDSCLIGFGLEYLGLLRHMFLLCLGRIMKQ